MGRSGDPRKRNAAPPPPSGEETVITIVPGRDPDAPTECLLSWQGHDWTARVERVRATAVDLFTAAAWADLMMLLVVRVRLDKGIVGAMAGDLLKTYGRTGLGSPATVTLMPGGWTPTRTPLVIVSRGPLQGALTTTQARQMGLAWLTAAEAAESDQLVTEALRTAGGLSDDRIDGLFAYMRELRSTGADRG